MYVHHHAHSCHSGNQFKMAGTYLNEKTTLLLVLEEAPPLTGITVGERSASVMEQRVGGPTINLMLVT